MALKRVFLGITVTAFAVLSFGGQAVSAPIQGPQQHSNGVYADSHWITNLDNGFDETTLVASQSGTSGTLYIDRLVVTETGATETTTDVTSGFLLSVGTPSLDAASLSGTNLSTTVCNYDSNWNPIGDCSDGTPVNVDVAWAGFGSITHTVSFEKRTVDGHVVIVHASGTMRLATATGSYGESALGDSDHAHIGIAKSVTIKR